MDNVSAVRILRNLGGAETSRGRLDDAQVLIERALADAERLLGHDDGFVGYAYMFLGGSAAQARPVSRGTRASAGGRSDQRKTGDGRIDIGVADGAESFAAVHFAREELAKALAKEWPVGPGQYRWVLVRALWALGRRDEAIAAVKQAERELSADADGAIDRAAVRAWLSAHAGAVSDSRPQDLGRAP